MKITFWRSAGVDFEVSGGLQVFAAILPQALESLLSGPPNRLQLLTSYFLEVTNEACEIMSQRVLFARLA